MVKWPGINAGTLNDVDKYNEYFTFDTSAKEIKIKVKNQTKVISNLTLYKYDKSGKVALKDAEFQIYFNNIESVTIDKTEYPLSKIRKSKIETINNEKYYVYRKNRFNFSFSSRE